MKKTEKLKFKIVTDCKKVKYECKTCSYTTPNKTDYFRHLKTKKHIYKSSRKQKTDKTTKNDKLPNCICKCGKKYKTRSGLWKHYRKCIFGFNTASENASENVSKNVSKNVSNVSNVSKTNPNVSAPTNNVNITSVDEKLKQQQSQINQLKIEKLRKEIKQLDSPNNSLTNGVESIVKISGDNNCNNTNNTNNISINMYLNENCKNAMNLEDFVRNITVSLKDLDFSTQNGYVKGITNIFMKQLEGIDPTKRPIHCSDKKRLQFYVKDDNKWEKDNDNVKLTNSIKNVGMEQVKKMTTWEEEHPDYMNNPAELNEWQKMLENISGGINDFEIKKNQSKIQKELCKAVDINVELY